MFEHEQQAITDQIRALCAERGLPAPELAWNPIPFSGEWGISTSFFQLAAAEGRLVKEQTGQGINVPQRAQELAALAAEHLGRPAGFARLEAVKGYLNLYFNPAEYAQRVVRMALAQGVQFGRGLPKGQRVMVEFSMVAAPIVKTAPPAPAPPPPPPAF